MEIAGRWKVLEERWPEGFARDWQRDRESAQCGYCFCRRARSSLWSQHGTGCFPFHRWRQELGQGSLQRREHGSDRCGVRPAEPERLICLAVGDSSHSMVALQRRPGQRRVSLDRWRHDLETTRGARASERPLRAHRAGGRGELGARVCADRSQGRRALPLRRWGGDTWDLVNGSHGLLQRPWYYMHIIADPQDANTLYVLDVEFFKSTDGGRNFNKIKVPHGDNHGLWIDPKNTMRMIASDDGGVTVTLDGGKSWTREDNQPTAQFYHVITDTRTPYYVYGAQQDNSTVAIASRSDDGAIGRDDWYEIGGGEAGY